MAKITIRGLDRVLDREAFSGSLDLRDPMNKSVLLMLDELGTYPPQRPTSYKRTGRLGRSWTKQVKKQGKRLEGKVGNNLLYAKFVQGKGTQAKVHRNHWDTEEDLLKENEETIRGFFSDYVNDAFRG